MMGPLRMGIIVSTAIVAETLAGFPHPIAAQAGTSGCRAPFLEGTYKLIESHMVF